SQSLVRMREQCQIEGREQLWEIFTARVVSPAFEGGDPMPYQQLIDRFGLQTPLQASNALTTAKRMFAKTLRTIVAEYANSPDAVEREIGELKEVLSEAGA